MNAEQPEGRQFENALHGLLGGTTRNRESEFLVLVGSCDEFVRVCLDSHRDPYEDRLNDASRTSSHRNTLNLLKGVQDDSSDTCINRPLNLGN